MYSTACRHFEHILPPHLPSLNACSSVFLASSFAATCLGTRHCPHYSDSFQSVSFILAWGWIREPLWPLLGIEVAVRNSCSEGKIQFNSIFGPCFLCGLLRCNISKLLDSWLFRRKDVSQCKSSNIVWQVCYLYQLLTFSGGTTDFAADLSLTVIQTKIKTASRLQRMNELVSVLNNKWYAVQHFSQPLVLYCNTFLLIFFFHLSIILGIHSHLGVNWCIQIRAIDWANGFSKGHVASCLLHLFS